LYLGAVDRAVPGSNAGWNAHMRIEVSNRSSTGNLLPFADWGFSAPTLVFSSTRDSSATYAEAAGGWGRPQLDAQNVPVQPAPEFVPFGYLDRSGNNTVRITSILDADACVAVYGAIADGNTAAPDDLWRTACTPAVSFYTEAGVGAWQTPDAVLNRVVQHSGSDIYRVYVYGNQAGTSELLIENAASPNPDTGL
jgi:hypothetical protein